MTGDRRGERETALFSPAAVLWIIFTGLFSLSALVSLSIYAPDLRGGQDAGAHALSPSAVGFAGLVQLLRDTDRAVVISRRSPDRRNRRWSLLVLTPSASVTQSDLQPFTGWGPNLIILPKWRVSPDPDMPGWVDEGGLIDAADIDRLLAIAVPGATLARRTDIAPVALRGSAGSGHAASTGPIEQLQTLTPGAGEKPWIVDAHGASIVILSHDKRTAILSDPDLLNTHGLKDLDTARTALWLIGCLRNGEGPLAFDVTLNGFGSPPSLAKLALEPPFLGATLCFFGAAVLIALRAASRFVPQRRGVRAIAFGKRVLADNAAALIRVAKREPHMAARYLQITRSAVAAALGTRRLRGYGLDAYLERPNQADGSGRRLRELAAETATVTTRAGLLQVARALYDWRLEITRERR